MNERQRRIAQLKEAQRIINDLLAKEEAGLTAEAIVASSEQTANTGEKKKLSESIATALIVLLGLIKDISMDVLSTGMGGGAETDYTESSLYGMRSHAKSSENKTTEQKPTEATEPVQSTEQKADAAAVTQTEQPSQVPMLEDKQSQEPTAEPTQQLEQTFDRPQLPDHQMQQTEEMQLPPGVKGLLPLLNTIDDVLPGLNSWQAANTREKVPVEVRSAQPAEAAVGRQSSH